MVFENLINSFSQCDRTTENPTKSSMATRDCKVTDPLVWTETVCVYSWE